MVAKVHADGGALGAAGEAGNPPNNIYNTKVWLGASFVVGRGEGSCFKPTSGSNSTSRNLLQFVELFVLVSMNTLGVL